MCQIMTEAGGFYICRNVSPRVLKERDEIIGGVGDECVLKIEDADARGAPPIRKPQKVLRMKIAQ
jgi:hypothetical protein